MKKIILIFVLQILFVYSQDKAPKKFNQTDPSSRYSNPNFIKDRQYKPKEIDKPVMPEAWKDRFIQTYDPAWMDYCDPWHCNDYHRRVCGLNRMTMRFKWFQSVCHLIVNNQCSTYRGLLKFDMIENHFCDVYVMFLRQGCPTSCDDEDLDPKCAQNMIKGNIVLFKNQCSLDAANCKTPSLEEYEDVRMEICQDLVRRS